MAQVRVLGSSEVEEPSLKIIDSQPPEIITKTCNKCGIEKELNEFSPQEGGLYGYRGVCKECRNENERKVRSHSRPQGNYFHRVFVEAAKELLKEHTE